MMRDSNIIKNFFSDKRKNFDSFYNTEKEVISKVFSNFNLDKKISVLDIGCATGGLFSGLKEIHPRIRYTGIDIDKKAIEFAIKSHPEASFKNDNYQSFLNNQKEDSYDVIFSLSCIDWDTINSPKGDFSEILKRIFKYVKPGGNLIFSIRLSDNTTLFNSKKSIQVISDGIEEIKAFYSIISHKDFLETIKTFQLSEIIASGFSGKPSETAITPYEKINFVVFSLKKSSIDYDLNVPDALKVLIKNK